MGQRGQMLITSDAVRSYKRTSDQLMEKAEKAVIYPEIDRLVSPMHRPAPKEFDIDDDIASFDLFCTKKWPNTNMSNQMRHNKNMSDQMRHNTNMSDQTLFCGFYIGPKSLPQKVHHSFCERDNLSLLAHKKEKVKITYSSSGSKSKVVMVWS